MKINYIQYNDVCITLTARILKNNLYFSCACTLTTFQKQISNNKWSMVMLIWTWLLVLLMLMS